MSSIEHDNENRSKSISYIIERPSTFNQRIIKIKSHNGVAVKEEYQRKEFIDKPVFGITGKEKF